MPEKNGRDMGRQVVDVVRGYVARAVAQVEERCKALLEPVMRRLDELERRSGGAGEKGEPGAPGRDALDLVVLPLIDPDKSYPRGTYAEHRGGIVRALRNTDPIAAVDLAAAGWVVTWNGHAETDVQLLEEGRVIELSFTRTDGKVAKSRLEIPVMLYRGIWTEAEHRRGDVVTWGGSAWHCQAEKTLAKPGTPNCADWKLMVKEGRAGRDGRDGKDAAPVVHAGKR